MKSLSIIVALGLAGPVAADDLTDFLGRHGCTIGAQSRAAALAAGFTKAQIDALAETALADGTASRQRAYVVLDETACAIHLPDLADAETLAEPANAALVSAIDRFAADGDPGCFLLDASDAFRRRYPGDDGNRRYLGFLARGIVSGEMRFFSTDPLRTPPSFQVLTGACAQVPGMGDISRSQRHISDRAFGSYMRLRMKAVDCDKPGHAPELAGFVATLQGADPQAVAKAEPPVNAWLWFEYDLIAFGAGWLDGASWVYKGDPRPPLCHYPAE